MKRKKHHLTAKTLTLRLAAIALVMALLALLLGFYTPLPSQVIDQREKEFGTGPTKVLEHHWFHANPAYLLGSENSLSLLFCRYNFFYGWGSDGGTMIDLSQEVGPVWLSTTLYSGSKALTTEGEPCDLHHFGRVDWEGAESVRLSYPSGAPKNAQIFPLFRGEDGHLYFWSWQTIPWFQSSPVDYFDVDVDVLDAEGTVLYTYETNPSYTEEELEETENKGSLSEGAGSAKH